MFKRYKAAKRVLALLLCGCLVFGSVYQTRQKAYAGAAGLIAGGAVAGGLAFAYLMGMMGVTASTPDPYQSSDALSAWASEQVASYKAWCKELHEANQDAWHPEELDAEFNAWCTRLGQGVLDKSSAIWADFKSWISDSFYKKSMSSSEPLNIASGVNMHFYSFVFSDSRGTCVLDVTFKSPKSEQAIFSYSVGNTMYYNVVFRSDGLTSKAEYLEYFKESGKQFSKRTYSYGGTGYEVGKIFCNSLWSTSVDDLSVLVSPKYLGDYTGTSNAFSLVSEKARSLVLDGSDYVVDPVDSSLTGGISDVYMKSNVLDDVDIVGGVDAPTRAGELAIPIAWPVDEDKLVDWLGKLKDGTITWSDAVARVGAAAIDVATDVPYVIGNEGVTTKEYTYAQDKADEKEDEIDIPAEGTKPSAAVGSYTLAGLEKLFPFCLPFDLMDFIGVLNATPQAPKFTIPFKYPTRGGTETYDVVIDLSSFDSVAELLRDMECLAFIVGLIMITRSRMIRG